MVAAISMFFLGLLVGFVLYALAHAKVASELARAYFELQAEYDKLEGKVAGELKKL